MQSAKIDLRTYIQYCIMRERGQHYITALRQQTAKEACVGNGSHFTVRKGKRPSKTPDNVAGPKCATVLHL
jgi:hypothetical protein